jgi:capsular polysaccharide transport system ATP-binding protein
MIEVNNISKHYMVQGMKKDVFSNLSFQIPSGARFALMGRNGAGKSTLLRLLCGIEKPNKGTVNITSTLSWPVGVSGGFIATLTGKENIKFVCRLLRSSYEETLEKIEFVKEFSQIGEYINMPVHTYSSGMRSKLSFGLSMAFDFDFYIVDEALSVGDSSFKKKSKEVFRQKSAEKGIIMVSHSMATVREYCDQGIFLGNNKITQSNNLEEVIKAYQESS